LTAARLSIPLTAVGSLPEGSGYRARSGRASASVERRGDTLVVEATCDSLLRLVERYERREAERKLAAEGAEKEEREESRKGGWPVRWVIIAFMAGVATGATLTTLIIGRIRQNKQA